jgi:hypothetical protein
MKAKALRAGLQNVSSCFSASGMQKCNKNLHHNLLYSESTMPILISSNFRRDSVFCSGDNSGSKFILIFISFCNVGQVIVSLELSFEDGEGVFDRVVIR